MRIPNGWQLRRVGEFCTYYKGGTPFEKLEYCPVGVPVLAKGDIKRFGRLQFSGTRFVDATRVEKEGFYLTGPGDFLMTSRDLTQAGDVLGLIARVPEEQKYLVNQGVNVVRFSEEIDWRFMVYCANGPVYREHMRAHAVGSTQIHIRKEAFTSAPVLCPPIAEQRRIAAMLGALDDKIELCRSLNATIEATARALFKAWFVDYEPIRAKAAGLDLSWMDSAVAALLPSKIARSPVGEVPEGWALRSLGEVADINPLRQLQRGAIAPYVEMSSLPTAGHRPTEWPLREAGSGARFQNGDTLFARITPCLENGKTGFVDFLTDGEVGWGSTEYIVIRPRQPLPLEWGYLLARDAAFRDFATRKMEGTSGRQRVSADAMAQYQVCLPSNAVCEFFASLVGPLFKKMAANHDEMQTLASIRDALLPRLLSGELRMPMLPTDARAAA